MGLTMGSGPFGPRPKGQFDFDPPTRIRYVEDFPRRVRGEKDGVTVLCSLHFLDLVHRYADRVVALNQGELVFEGLPKEIDDQKFKDIYGRDAERVG